MSYSRTAGGRKPIFKHDAQVKVVTMTYIYQEGLQRIRDSLEASGRLFLYLPLTSDLLALGVMHFGPADQYDTLNNAKPQQAVSIWRGIADDIRCKCSIFARTESWQHPQSTSVESPHH